MLNKTRNEMKELEDKLESLDINYGVVADDTGFEIRITGSEYIAVVSKADKVNHYNLETINRDRLWKASQSERYTEDEALERASAHNITRKTLRGVVNYIERYTQ